MVNSNVTKNAFSAGGPNFSFVLQNSSFVLFFLIILRSKQNFKVDENQLSRLLLA